MRAKIAGHVQVLTLMGNSMLLVGLLAIAISLISGSSPTAFADRAVVVTVVGAIIAFGMVTLWSTRQIARLLRGIDTRMALVCINAPLLVLSVVVLIGWHQYDAAGLAAFAAVPSAMALASAAIQPAMYAEPVCLNCAYPVRGLPGPNCPECGEPIPDRRS